MRAIFFTGDQTAELGELPDPHPGLGQVRLRVHASSICGTDLHRYRHTAEAREPFRRIVTGHEAAGVVDEVGDGVDSALVGTRAVVFQAWGCTLPEGPCEEATRPGSKRCPHATIMGVNTHGGNADYQIVPASAVLPLPDDLDWDDAVLLACSFGTAVSAIEKTGAVAGETAIVFGLGPIGLCSSAVLAGRGVEVLGVDLSEPRRAQAALLGIEVASAAPDDLLANIAVDSTGNPAVQAAITANLAPEGRIVLIGLGAGTSVGANQEFIVKELQLRGTMVFSVEQWAEVLAVYRALPFRLATLLVNEHVTPEESIGAFTRAAGGTTSKVLVDWVAA